MEIAALIIAIAALGVGSFGTLIAFSAAAVLGKHEREKH